MTDIATEVQEEGESGPEQYDLPYSRRDGPLNQPNRVWPGRGRNQPYDKYDGAGA